MFFLSHFFFVQPLWCFFFVFFLMSKQEERREQKEKSTHDIHTVNSTYASNIRSQSTHKKRRKRVVVTVEEVLPFFVATHAWSFSCTGGFKPNVLQYFKCAKQPILSYLFLEFTR